MSSAPQMRPLSVGEVLDAALKLSLANARLLISTAAVIAVPAQVVIGLISLALIPSGRDFSGNLASLHASSAGRTAGVAAGTLVAGGLDLLCALIVTASLMTIVSDLWLGHDPLPHDSIRHAVRRLPVLIAAEILRWVGLVIGLVLLIVPGVYLGVSWTMLTPALILEGTGPAGSLGRSRRLVAGRWWPVLGAELLAAIMSAVVGGVVEALLSGLDGFSSDPGRGIAVVVSVVVGIVASVITTPFLASVTTILFYDLRARHEGGFGSGPVPGELGPDSVGLPGGPPFWPPPPGWTPPPQGLGPPPSPGEPLRPGEPIGPDSVGRPGGPPYWPPPPDWTPDR